jgi:uncharacterized protein YgiM (DUF1202 family)
MINYKTSLITLLMICLTGIPCFAAGQNIMSIQVKNGEIRSAPSFLGGIIARLSYGDQVYVREKRGSWVKVSLPGNSKQGWIHSSALTVKKVMFKAGDADVQTSASSDELALAGKGFSKQVENEFKQKNPKINYAWVDRMETFVASEKEIKQFLKEGKLSPKGGS